LRAPDAQDTHGWFESPERGSGVRNVPTAAERAIRNGYFFGMGMGRSTGPSHDAKDEGEMRSGTNLLHGHGQDAPPVVVSWRQPHRGPQPATIAGFPRRQKSGGST